MKRKNYFLLGLTYLFAQISYAQSTCFTSISANNPVTAIWSMDGNTNDVSGSSNNATGGIIPTFSATAISGQAAYFNGTGGVQYSRTTSPTFMTDLIAEISFGAWFKPDNLTSNMMLFEEGNNTNGISVHLNNTGQVVFAVKEGSNGNNNLTFPFPTDGAFHHISFTYDGPNSGRLTAMLDGKIMGSASYVNIGNINVHSDGGGVGQEFGGSAIRGLFSGFTAASFSGYIDEAYYSRSIINYGNLQQYLRCNGYGIYPSLSCASDAFMSQTSTGTWISINLGTGSSTSPVNDGYAEQINAIGFNELDGLIYGVANSSAGNYITITSLGISAGNYVYNTAAVALVPQLVGKNIVVGDIYNGLLYLREASASTVYIINVDPASPAYLRLVNTLNPGSSGVSLTDWAFTNDGRLYGINNSNGNLIQYDPATGVASAVATGVVAGGTSISYGAVYVDNNDYLYVYRNSNGQVYRINLNGPDYKGVLFSTAVGNLDFNDGARCANAPVPLDFGDAPDNSTATSGGGTGVGQYGTMLSNNGPRHLVNVLVPLRMGATVTLENDGKPGAEATGDTDDGVTSFPAIAGGGTRSIATYSVNVAVTNATTAVATLYGWIDWNDDGEFQLSERAAVSVGTGSNNNIVSLTWNNITLGGAVGSPGVYARFRLSTDIAAAMPTGAASDGEVEDYFIAFNNVLPVVLRSFDAFLREGQLIVNWETLYEVNNSRFEIEASADGRLFKKIGEVKTKAVSGNSDSILKYDFMSLYNAAGGLMSLSIAFFSCMSAVVFMRRKIYLFLFPLLVFVFICCGCSKESLTEISEPDIYLRIAQVDLDGKVHYSKVIKVVRK